MRIDFDALMEQEGGLEEAGDLAESRCYTVRGTRRALDAFERMMRRVEWIGERGVTRVVTVFVDGRQGAKLKIRSIANWAEEEPVVEDGAPLPRLKDEEIVCSHYVENIG